jgi:sugar/nucleoside kinase (ribokinase family)
MLDSLCEARLAEMVVVTAGHEGALARTSDGQTVVAAATAVNVLQVRGAGATFSAALIHARHDGADPGQAVRFACAAGSLWCSRTQHGPLPGADEISAFASSA